MHVVIVCHHDPPFVTAFEVMRIFLVSWPEVHQKHLSCAFLTVYPALLTFCHSMSQPSMSLRWTRIDREETLWMVHAASEDHGSSFADGGSR